MREAVIVSTAQTKTGEHEKEGRNEYNAAPDTKQPCHQPGEGYDGEHEQEKWESAD